MYFFRFRHHMTMDQRLVSGRLNDDIAEIEEHRDESERLMCDILHFIEGGFGNAPLKIRLMGDIDDPLVGDHVVIQVPPHESVEPEVKKDHGPAKIEQ